VDVEDAAGPGGGDGEATEETGEEDQVRPVGRERGVDGSPVGRVVGVLPAAADVGRDAGVGRDRQAAHTRGRS
jgi:hypothetical protein